jgi:hypothetical protein
MAWWWSPSKYAKKIVWCFGEVIVRGVVLAPRESQRATLVERDTKGDKWSGESPMFGVGN